MNKAIVLGRLGQDPEIRHTQSGDAVATFSLATSDAWKDKITGERKEETEWHRCVAWRKSAEIIAEHAKKGAMLLVEGRMKTRKWQDKDGVDRYTGEIIVDQFQFVGSKPERGNSSNSEPPGQSQNADYFDDDIPF